MTPFIINPLQLMEE
jgi:hypothetical protein